MNSEQILALPAHTISQSQREFYFDQGYLSLPGLISGQHLAPLKAALSKIIENSRELAQSNSQFDLEHGHSAENPRLRRATYIDDLDEVFWEFCSNSIITDIATDLLGPNLRFRDLMANFKWAGGGAEVKWHQDIVFYPHTNTGTCQFLVALEDIGSEQGPLQVIPGSHKGPIYAHYDAYNQWTGAMNDADLKQAGVDDAIELTGPAGTVTVHHSCTIHGSDKNMSSNGRPVLVITYAAADAISYTAAPYPSSHYGVLVRGQQPRFAHHEELLMPLPPDWSQGYTSIFDHQEPDHQERDQKL